MAYTNSLKPHLNDGAECPLFDAPVLPSGIGPRTSVAAGPKESLQLQVYGELHDLYRLQGAWEELLSAFPASSIFSSWDWLISWWESFHENRRLLLLAAFDSHSRLVGLAPLSVSMESFLGFVQLPCLRLMGDGSNDSDNLDLLVRPGFEDAFAEKLIEYLEENHELWQVARLNTFPSDSPMHMRLGKSLAALHWTSFIDSRDCSFVVLPPNSDQYFQTLFSGKHRKNLVRESRRLEERFSVRISRCTHEGELPNCLEALFRLHQLRWRQAGEPGSFAGRHRCEFYQRLSRRLLAKGRLELWVLKLDDKIAAAQFAMRYGDKVYQLQEGYDPAHSADRIGVILRAEVLRRLISEGIRIYDFLGGMDNNKQRWGATGGKYYDLTFARTWSIGSAVIKCAYYGKTVKEWLRLHLPVRAWRILHRLNVASKNRFDKDSSGKPEPVS